MGTLINAPSNVTINILSSIEYNRSDQFGPIQISWPVAIINTTPSLGYLSVNLATTQGLPIDLTTDNHYIIIASEYIRILGSSANNIHLNVDNVQSYPGFIQNGYYGNSSNGYGNLEIRNITLSFSINPGPGSTLYAGPSSGSSTEAGGWLCKTSFGYTNASSMPNIFIENCTIGQPGNYANLSPQYCGGLIGSLASGNIEVSGCRTYGYSLGEYSGGIIGASAGYYSKGSDAITITSCIFESSFNTYIDASYSGGICGAYAGIHSFQSVTGVVNINSCNNTGFFNKVVGTGASGICGGYARRVNITNCSNNANISGTGSGGICGGNGATNFSDQININNCTNSGIIEVGSDCGGIVGSFSGYVNVTNCFNYGAINSPGGGGIVGGYAGSVQRETNIINCSTSGFNARILAFGAGGICGAFSARVNINNCSITNFANIIAQSAGGIVGRNAGSRPGEGVTTITNCFSSVTIQGEYSGGICGEYAGTYLAISKCYSIGTMQGDSSGGICGAYAGIAQVGGETTITNCYSLGDINGNGAGGICGLGVVSSGVGGLRVQNCYSMGEITGDNAGGIFGPIAGASSSSSSITNSYVYQLGPVFGTTFSGYPPSVVNVYSANGDWTDASANQFLVDVPTNPNSIGSVWTSLAFLDNVFRQSYALSAFNSEIYDPSYATTTSLTYTSGQPILLDISYSGIIGVNNGPTPSGITFGPNFVLGFNISPPVNSQYIVNVFVADDRTPFREHYYGYNINTFTLNVENPGPGPEPDPEPTPNPRPISNICFAANTPIETDQGVFFIQDINPKNHTINNKKILALTETISQDAYLVCFKKDSLANKYPSQDITMSKDHKVYYKGKMIEAKEFLGRFENVKIVYYNGESLYNILLEDYDKIKVCNLYCDTLHPKTIVAKLHMSNLSEEYKRKIISLLNDCINKNDHTSYKKIVNRI